MGKRGRKRDLDREIRYWHLIANGVGTGEACRQVGVTRKTGYRWRSEIGGVIAKKPPPRLLRPLPVLARSAAHRLAA